MVQWAAYGGLPARLFLAVLLVQRSTATGGRKLFQSSKNVYELDATKVESDIANARNAWVVMYYADWCPHCHHYAPMFERIAAAVSPLHQGDVHFGALNCPDFMAFCMKIQVSGYPSVRAYHFKGDTGSSLSGKTPDRKMVHQEDAFVAWIRKNVPSQSIETPANLTVLGLHTVPVLVSTKPGTVPKLRGHSEAVGTTSIAAASVLHQTEALSDALPALHLVDAEVAILYSLSQGAFLKGSPDGMLRGDSLVELQRWLDFLSRRLPGSSHRDLKSLADRTREALDDSPTGDALAVSAFQTILLKQGLDRAPPEAGVKPDAYWRRCKGFTCGLWTLFHVLSQAKGPPDTAGQELLTRIRGFVANFFGCQQCREHFLEAFDSCKFDRCHLKADDAAGAALWLWKMHNDVTLRVAAESGRPMPNLWPAVEDCKTCRLQAARLSNVTTRFDEAAVLAHLRSEYWSSEWQQDHAGRPFMPGPVAEGFLGTLVFAVCLATWMESVGEFGQFDWNLSLCLPLARVVCACMLQSRLHKGLGGATLDAVLSPRPRVPGVRVLDVKQPETPLNLDHRSESGKAKRSSKPECPSECSDMFRDVAEPCEVKLRADAAKMENHDRAEMSCMCDAATSYPKMFGLAAILREMLEAIRMAFPRAYSSISHDQMLRQASTYWDSDTRRRYRAHSPEVECGTPRVHARSMPQPQYPQSPGQLPRAWSAVTWCSNGLHASANIPMASPQKPRVIEKPAPFHFPQPPKAVVVQSNALRLGGFGGAQSPRLRQQQPRLISSPPQSPAAATSSISALVGCGAPDRKARASGQGQAQSTSRPAPSERQGSDAEDAPEFSIPSTDLDGLLRYLYGLCQRGLRITEATYCVNSWNLYGLIPLKHHGFILFTKGCRLDSYLTLDFSSRGILWDTFDTYPDVPEGTFFAKTYNISLDPLALREYCKDTEPFSWPHNDCKKWAKGMLRLMGIKEDPDVDGAIDKLTRGNMRLRDIITCGGSTAPSASRFIGCMQ
ncbi:QSOX2 [Symbiodinium natans]|uniref:Sulfhydryl oxidase n=1 Tax=Symbiodinium natans TaxID=878477 RepID=A0A812PGP7_9DINO|nr:QSOX2 [Symbiodinium natans]